MSWRKVIKFGERATDDRLVLNSSSGAHAPTVGHYVRLSGRARGLSKLSKKWRVHPNKTSSNKIRLQRSSTDRVTQLYIDDRCFFASIYL